MSLKILQLSKKPPFPLKDGESIAISYLSKALAELGCEMTLLTMATSKHPVSKEDIVGQCTQYKEIRIVEVDTQIKIWDAILNLFKNESYHISRFISNRYKKELKQLLQEEEFDILQLETLYLAPYLPTIRKYSNAKICMRSHNIEHEIWERIAQNNRNPIKKLYLKYLARKLKKYEIKNLNKYDLLISVSERDLKKLRALGYKKEGFTSPIGINLSRYDASESKNTLCDICFIGALDWMPNVEGLMWFFEKVWPTLSLRNPGLKFHIAGRNIGSNIKAFASDNVIIHGEVNNAINFINTYEVMIVPLFSGSGTRVKILEGMSLGKTIVTTSIGKEGIEVQHGKHLLVADTPIDFISHIETLLGDDNFRNNLSRNAKIFVQEHYDHLDNAQSLLENYQLLV